MLPLPAPLRSSGVHASAQASLPPPADPPTVILFLAANPVDTTPLRLDVEMRAIDEVLQKTPYRTRFNLQQQWRLRPADFEAAPVSPRHRPLQ